MSNKDWRMITTFYRVTSIRFAFFVLNHADSLPFVVHPLRICFFRFDLYSNSVPWASYQIRKIADCACAGNAGNVSLPPISKETLVSDPDMHHGTCVTHVPWCMSGSLTGIRGAYATRNFTYLARGPYVVVIRYASFCIVIFLLDSPRHREISSG